MDLPPGVIDSAVFKVGSVEGLEAALNVGFGAATITSGPQAAPAGGNESKEWIHDFLEPVRTKWPGLEGHVVLDVEEEGIRLHQAGPDGTRGAEIAWLPFGSFSCRIHRYPFEVTLDLEARDYGSCWLEGKSGIFHRAPVRVARLLFNEEGQTDS